MKGSTNPFDDSSDDNTESDGFQDCTDLPASSSLSDTATPLIGSEIIESKIAKKRTAPLSFNESVIVANPVLRFDEGNTSTSAGEFFSPLESALLSQSNRRNGGSRDDEDDGDNVEVERVNNPKDNIDNLDGESYLSGWVSYLLNSPRQLTEQITGDDTTTSIPAAEETVHLLMESTHSFLSTSSRPPSRLDGQIPISEDKADDIQSDKRIIDYQSITASDKANPLSEAKDVIERMDSVSRTIHSAMKATSNKIKTKQVQKRSKAEEEADRRILRTIEDNPKDSGLTMNHKHAGTPWTRLIILEELGTSSSWIILLIPYIAFLLALALDSDTLLWNVISGPIEAKLLCHSTHYIQSEQCLEDKKVFDEALASDLDYGADVVMSTGAITDVPVMSAFLYGDLLFDNLTSTSVSLISDGMVFYVNVVLQQPIGSSPVDDRNWHPVSISKPRNLDIVCNNEAGHFNETHWKCSSPRNVDVLFSRPDTSILTGGAIRVDTLLSFVPPQNQTDQDRMKSLMRNKFGFLYGEDLKMNTTVSNPDVVLSEIAHSTSYTIIHSSSLKPKIVILVRILTLIINCAFIVFWFWSMGINGFFGAYSDACCCTCFRSWDEDEEESLVKKAEELPWWDSPWFLFPERRYLLLLLFALLLVQNPVLTYMYFHPHLYGDATMHVIADSLIGIGVHGVLCLWYCLFHGLRFHTADLARKRADNQKRILELRRTRKYLAEQAQINYQTSDTATDFVTSYYDEFGDIDGTGTIGMANLRMKHDPFGDNWADFIFPKLLLFLIGAGSVVATGIYRFPASIEESSIEIVSQNPQHHSVFVATSLAQIIILGFWIILIIRSVLKTGAVLRKEPFLSTRPAQLAFRILVNIIVLGVASVVIPFLFDVIILIGKWNAEQRQLQLSLSARGHTMMGILLKVVLHVTERFPYSGTAAGLGPGELIYITSCTLVVAFIFLPSTTYFDLESDGRNEPKQERQRNDKRSVVTLARYTPTWRVFPLPIERHFYSASSILRAHEVFQLKKNFQHYANAVGRAMIYKENYTPVFCVETALWLLECCWQTYYSSTEFKTDDFAPGKMDIQSIGLQLEADIYDDETDTRAFVSSNLSSQVDGEEDSIIVVAFRGTASSTNVKTDFNFNQVPLPELFGVEDVEQPEFQIKVGTTLDSERGESVTLVKLKRSKDKSLKQGANKLLKKAPIARQAFPRVHNGFIQSYFRIRAEVIGKVLQVIERQLNHSLQRCHDNQMNPLPLSIPKIYVCGHSLGGALAQLLALDISRNIEITNSIPLPRGHKRRVSEMTPRSRTKSNIERTHIRKSSSTDASVKTGVKHGRSRSYTSGQVDDSLDIVQNVFGVGLVEGEVETKSLRPPVAVYTFGQPRIGNHPFARHYKANVPHTFRVVSEGDAVTALPFASFWGGLAFYKHAGLEVLLDEGGTGNILVGPTVVETMFRFSKVRTNLKAHALDSYRDGLESALTMDELQEFYRGHGGEDARESGNPYLHEIPDWVTHLSSRKR